MKKLIGFIQRRRVQLRWKLLGGFFSTNLLLLVALGLALATLFGIAGLLDNLKTSNERSQVVLQMDATESEMVNRVLDYIWTDNQTRFNEYELLRKSLEEQFNSFSPYPLQQENFDSLKKELKTLQALLAQMIKLTDNGQDKEAQLLWRTQGSKQSANLRTLLQELNQQETHLAELNYKEGEATLSLAVWLVIGLIAVALVLAVGLALLLTAALTGPVVQLRNRLANLAQGDLTQPVQIANGDELGDLGQTYNTTLGSLHDLVSQLYSQSQQVSNATEELIAQSGSQVSGSSQQVEAIAEATQSLQELNQTAAEIARQALRVTEAVSISLEQAQEVNRLTDAMVAIHEEGRETVAHTVEALQNLKDQIANIEQEQQAVAGQSKVIFNIVELIDSIAKETHLLALNASIEAAGAGEFGERFAVIAAEVKQLANRSVGETQHVRAALGGITAAVERVSQSAVNSLKEAERAVADGSSSDQVLLKMAENSQRVKAAAQEIVAQVKDTAMLASSIGVATRQQQSSSNLMLEKMLQIEAVTSQTLASVKQAESATFRLNTSARKLEQSADAFKLAA